METRGQELTSNEIYYIKILGQNHSARCVVSHTQKIVRKMADEAVKLLNEGEPFKEAVGAVLDTYNLEKTEDRAKAFSLVATELSARGHRKKKADRRQKFITANQFAFSFSLPSSQS